MEPPGPDRSFPKAAKVLRAPEFRRVRAAKRSVRDEILEIAWVRREPGPIRFGLVVPIRGLGAVGRNRIKRILREVFRLQRTQLPDGFDLVASPRDRVRAQDFALASASFSDLIRRFKERERLP